jgi:mono/diheme cytochrome c family protein
MPRRVGLPTALLLLALPALPARAADTAPADSGRFFETEVRPIIQAQCLTCHGGTKKVRGGLRLTNRDALLKGGDNGPAISLDKPGDSLLLQAVNYRDRKMPPKGRLPQAQIDVLTRWVEMGAPWPADAATAAVKHAGPPPVDDEARRFWAFRPVVRPPVPQVKDRAWVRNPIDAFVLAKLEAAGLHPAPPADRTTLLRRAYYAVTGLPPTPAEVEAFLADPAPDAYEKVVDRLLASPHYGEHWGRHWLDLVRYAETNSFERDADKPFAWRYRDYVIRSLNADKPYDRFLKEQLAGDELNPNDPDALIATGYYRLGPWDDEPVDPVQVYYDELDDVVTTTGQVFLGLTVNCARCHDHKIDPFRQRDYYRLLAFFHGIRRYDNGPGSLRLLAGEDERRRYQDVLAAHSARLADLDRQLAVIEDAVRPHLQGGERDDFNHEMNRAAIVKKHVPDAVSPETYEKYRSLRRERARLLRGPPAAGAQALCVTEDGPRPRDTFVLLRGNARNHGDQVEPGFPAVLTPPDAPPPAAPQPASGARTCGRRSVLAGWLADRKNPLTARVLVNRVWQYDFGRGIVRSSSNFGYQGTPPTHPELLDWLAEEFVAGGMRLKPLRRLLLTSSAFRMSSRGDPAAAAKDPENDLLAQFDLRRLTAEEVRDSVLAVSGNLNVQKAAGPSIYPLIPPEVLAGQSRPGNGWGQSTPAEAAARSIFVHVKRSLSVPVLAAFDSADVDATCPVRFTTTQPAQALALLNGEFVHSQAQVFADNVRAEAGPDDAARVRMVLRRVLQRPATAAEVERGARFLAAARDRDGLSAEEALWRFCLLALSLNEFVYVD